MSDRATRAYRAYIACVTAVGFALLVATLTFWRGLQVSDFGLEFALLALFVVAGELFPLRVLRDGGGELTVSTTFAFAILLEQGTAAAMLALVFATLLADSLQRKPWGVRAFNAAQMTLSLWVAGAAVGQLTGAGRYGSPIELSGATLAPAILAAGVFFVVNVLLLDIALALRTATSIGEMIRRDVQFQGLAAAVLLSLAPIVAAAADTIGLIPLFVVPMVAVYRSMGIFLEREHQALHDPLTGLPNRALFHDRAQQAIAAGGRTNARTAVLMVDLDGFKEVNDTLGHHAGDQLLREIADRLGGAVRASDTVARLGGDEFGVVLWAVADVSAVQTVVDHLRTVIEQPMVVDDLTLRVEGSVGVALAPEHGEDAETLIRHADSAMYAAKRARSGHRTYTPEDETQATRRLTLMAELRTAMDEDRLVLHYQPKATMSTGQISSVEALVRWRQEDALLRPDSFIPFAEQTGLMRPLTAYVLNAALRQTAAWHRAGHELRVAVNISVRDLHDDRLPEQVSELLERWDVPSHFLELEITEQSIMSDLVRAQGVLARLRGMGVVLAIDDFGTGNTSLAHLPRLPIDVIKIDKSFVETLTVDSEAVVVRTTIDLGHHLGLQVVAEGVASQEIWLRLDELGCDVAQGYFLSAPVTATELERWLVTSGRS